MKKHVPFFAVAFFIAILLFGTDLPVHAGGEKGRPKSYPLWPDGAPGAKGKEAKDIPSVTVYLPGKEKKRTPAVVICPGGGYGHLALDHEGHQVARWLNGIGIAGIILKYRIAPHYRHPAPLHDAQRALRFTRAHAKKWNIDPGRVGILGFSAGGHLASTATTQFDGGKEKGVDPIDKESCRPDFAVLCYPVVTLVPPYAHMGSRRNLLGKSPDKKLVELLCNEKQVTKKTPPCFLVHTSEDRAVPPENSVLFYLACRKVGVPVEMHIYERGRHGLGLGRDNLAFSSWPERCEAWFRTRGILSPSKGKN